MNRYVERQLDRFSLPLKFQFRADVKRVRWTALQICGPYHRRTPKLWIRGCMRVYLPTPPPLPREGHESLLSNKHTFSPHREGKRTLIILWDVNKCLPRKEKRCSSEFTIPGTTFLWIWVPSLIELERNASGEVCFSRWSLTVYPVTLRLCFDPGPHKMLRKP